MIGKEFEEIKRNFFSKFDLKMNRENEDVKFSDIKKEPKL